MKKAFLLRDHILETEKVLEEFGIDIKKNKNESKTCKNCGKDISDELFCPQCGTPNN